MKELNAALFSFIHHYMYVFFLNAIMYLNLTWYWSLAVHVQQSLEWGKK